MNKTIDVGVFKTNPDAIMPKYGTSESACFDFYVSLSVGQKIKIYYGNDKFSEHVVDKNRKIFLDPGERAVIPTGLIFDIPKKYCMKVYPRGSSGGKIGVNLANNVGIIDNDFREELFLLLHNINISERIIISHGDRLCQGEFVKYENNFVFSELSDRPQRVGDRTGGFGSTGTK